LRKDCVKKIFRAAEEFLRIGLIRWRHHTRGGAMRDAQWETVDAFMDVNAGLARLTDRQREVLKLTVLGWTQEEIAVALGIGQWTVSRELAAAREELAGDA
jgi:RNA polymerase sigma factor (sigma-70 family)